MVYLVGGYKQTLTRPGPCVVPPTWKHQRFRRRVALRESHKTCLLACGYHGETIWLVVTNKRIDPNATPDTFEEFKESERARQIKGYMNVDDVEFVTVADPYDYYY